MPRSGIPRGVEASEGDEETTGGETEVPWLTHALLAIGRTPLQGKALARAQAAALREDRAAANSKLQAVVEGAKTAAGWKPKLQ